MSTHSFIFCIVIIISFVFIDTSAYGPINLTLVDKSFAVSKGALCLDGSPPGYHFDEGFDDGIKSWIVFLEGGAWCNTTTDCFWRTYSAYGNSSKMKPRDFEGILDKEEINNPHFYNWNKVYVRYCDGASFMGDVEEVDPVTDTKLYYRGASIFDVVMEELLLARGMNEASNAILVGCSAGGLATILHCDGFRSLFPNAATRVKCISDGGFFIRAKDLPGAKKREEEFSEVVELHGLAKTLPSSCTSRIDPRLCLFPEYLVGDVQTPLFLLNSAFDLYQLQNLEPTLVDQPGWTNCTSGNFSLCTPRQLNLVRDFKTSFVQAINETGNCTSRGLLIHSCFQHCHAEFATIWENFRTLQNLTLSKVIGDWFFDRNSFQEIDTKNSTPRLCKNI